MPHFEYSGFVVGTGAIYILIAAAAFGVAMSYARKRWTRAITSVVSFAVITVVLNALAYSVSTGPNQPYATARDVAQAFGLQSGKPYPLVLGTRLGGSDGRAYARGGLFTATASVTVRPASALSVSFTNGSNSYILEIPVSKITFVQSDTEAPSVTLNLTKGDGDNVDDTFDNVTITTTEEPCTLVVHNFFTTCSKDVLTSTAELTAKIRRHGLPPVVESNLDSAVVVVTSEMYKKILGG